VIDLFASDAGRGTRVLRGWCDPVTAPRPLGPLIDALDGLDPQVAADMANDVETGDMSTVYRRLLEVHLSPKTVSHHVEAILTRLEVDNRVQAARELNRDTTPS